LLNLLIWLTSYEQGARIIAFVIVIPAISVACHSRETKQANLRVGQFVLRVPSLKLGSRPFKDHVGLCVYLYPVRGVQPDSQHSDKEVVELLRERKEVVDEQRSVLEPVDYVRPVEPFTVGTVCIDDD